MERYKNLGGDSGVSAFSIADASIEVKFKDGMIYLYTDQSAGREVIERMKNFAREGNGLNSYISRIVKKRYASKRRGQ